MSSYKDNEIIIRPSKLLFTLLSFSHALLLFLIHILDLYWYFTIALVFITLLSFYYYSKVYFLRHSKKQVKRLEYQEVDKTWKLLLGNEERVLGKKIANNFSSNIVLVLNFEIPESDTSLPKFFKKKKRNVVAIVFNDSVSIKEFRFLKRAIKYNI